MRSRYRVIRGIPKLWVDSVPVTGPAPASNTRSAALDGDDAPHEHPLRGRSSIAGQTDHSASGHGEVVKTKTRKKHTPLPRARERLRRHGRARAGALPARRPSSPQDCRCDIEEEDSLRPEAAERLERYQAKVVRHRPRPPRPVLDREAPAVRQMIGYDVEIRFSRRHQGTGVCELAPEVRPRNVDDTKKAPPRLRCDALADDGNLPTRRRNPNLVAWPRWLTSSPDMGVPSPLSTGLASLLVRVPGGEVLVRVADTSVRRSGRYPRRRQPKNARGHRLRPLPPHETDAGALS